MYNIKLTFIALLTIFLLPGCTTLKEKGFFCESEIDSARHIEKGIHAKLRQENLTPEQKIQQLEIALDTTEKYFFDKKN